MYTKRVAINVLVYLSVSCLSIVASIFYLSLMLGLMIKDNSSDSHLDYPLTPLLISDSLKCTRKSFRFGCLSSFFNQLCSRAGTPQQHMPITVGPYHLTHPLNFPCRRKPEYPEKTRDFRQSVDIHFSHEDWVL